MRLHRRAQLARPAGEIGGAEARARESAARIAAIGLERGVETALEHPREHLRRVEREMKLHQLRPHLLLRAPEEDDIARHHAGFGEQLAAEQQKRVERRAYFSAVTKEVAEVDQAVTGLETLRDLGVDTFEPLRLAMNRRHRPHPFGGAQDREFRLVQHVSRVASGRSGRRRCGGRRRRRQAASRTCSSCSAAASGAIFSTAANSRLSRLKAAS